jgi:hypothetical protein
MVSHSSYVFRNYTEQTLSATLVEEAGLPQALRSHGLGGHSKRPEPASPLEAIYSPALGEEDRRVELVLAVLGQQQAGL